MQRSIPRQMPELLAGDDRLRVTHALIVVWLLAAGVFAHHVEE